MNAAAREARFTSAPVLPLLVSLALPNMLAMVAAAAVSIAETRYVGELGRDALAAMAIVFPFVMMMQMFSAGAMGGGISSVISRALGAGDAAAARSLALHSAWIGIGGGIVFTLVFVGGGRWIFSALGARDDVLALAVAYADVAFGGATAVWLANTLISVLRGCGEMRVPSVTIVATVAAQIVIGAGFGLGLGPFPRWGLPGVALGQVLAFGGATLFLLGYLRSSRRRVPLAWRGIALRRAAFGRILAIGGLACLSPLQSVATVLVLTALVARLGPDALAGYGIGARLEFLLIPIAFGIGVATLPLVGMAVGRGDGARARRVAWTGGALSAGLVGAIGVVVAIWPRGWAGLFTDSAPVLAAAELYLTHAGPGYALFGLGLTLYFASQGAGRVLGPVLAATLRLAVVAGGGFALAAAGAGPGALFILVAVGMVVYGLATAASVHWARWGRQGQPRAGA
jgi:putative MATE family efflux protein